MTVESTVYQPGMNYKTYSHILFKNVDSTRLLKNPSHADLILQDGINFGRDFV